MPDRSPFQLFRSTPLLVLTFVLVAQGLAVRAVSRPERMVAPPPLTSFPQQIGNWHLAQEGIVDQETRDVLQADDLLTRTYSRPGSQLLTGVFIASFLSQRNGKAPHSPRNCLPGAGWVEQSSEFLPVDIPGTGRIVINHYVVANRDERSDVMYWYQSRNRVVASEYRAKLFVMADAIRYNRTDTALVRVITPIANSDDGPAAQTNIEFIRALFPVLPAYMPK